MVSLNRLSWVYDELQAGRKCRFSICPQIDRVNMNIKMEPVGNVCYDNSFILASIHNAMQLCTKYCVVDHGHGSSTGQSVIKIACKHVDQPRTNVAVDAAMAEDCLDEKVYGHAGIEEKNTWGQASTDPQTSVADIVAAGSPLPEQKHYSTDEPAAPLVSGGTCPFAKDDDFTNAGDDENAVCTTTAQSSLGLPEALDGVMRDDLILVRDHLKVLDKSLDVCNERLTDVGTCILQHPASSSAAAASPAVVQTVAATKETRAQIHDSMDVVNKLIFAGEQLREIVQSSDTSDPGVHERIERAIMSFKEMVIDKCKNTNNNKTNRTG